jgi:hypothetical protein
MDQYSEVIENKKKLKLDFDGAYQYTAAKYKAFKIKPEGPLFCLEFLDFDVIFP